MTGGTKGKQMMNTIQKFYYSTKDNHFQRSRVFVKLCCILITALLVAGFFQDTAWAASGIKIYDYATKKESTYKDKQVKVTLNGKTVTKTKLPGILVNGIALVPYDDVFQKSGIAAQCTYKSDKGTITIAKYGKTITMTIGSTKATVNGQKVTLPVAPMKIKYVKEKTTKVLVPSRFISEKLGLTYSWNSSTSTVAIVKTSLLLSFDHGEKFDYTGAQGKVTVNGKNISLGNMPSIITNNTAMLRAKKVFTDASIGAAYSYNKSDKSITLTKDDKTLVMYLGKKTAYLNGNAMTMDTAPILVTNHDVNTSYVMVPGGFTASCLGYDYKWNNSTRTSMITTQKSQALAGNHVGSGSVPELGDSGVMTEVGTILGQWVGADTAYQKSSGARQITAEKNTANGAVTTVERDYNNLKLNAETFIFNSTGSFGAISSQSSDKVITIKAEGMVASDQTYQAYGVFSNYVNTIGIYNNGDNSTSIQLDMLSTGFSYDISLSGNRQSLYVTVYYNSLTSAVIGTNNYCDYVTLTGIEPLKVTPSLSGGYISIELPYTSSSFGDINTMISGAKYINYINVVGGTDKTYVIIGVNEGYEFSVSQNQNQYSLIFMLPGSNVTDGSIGSGSVGSGSGNGGFSLTLDKAVCEIIMPKPEGLTSDMMSDEDHYFQNTFVIRLQGDYTSVINNSTITNTSGTVTGISVSLNSNNETEITVRTSKLQGYQYGMDDTNIYINVGNPKEIYKNIVILDPGHGGGANGAEYFGTKEKDLNYKILYTIGKKYFNQDTSKLKVYYTRITDVDMSLSDRAAFASKYGADLFVSLHMNAALTKTAHGTEVYYSTSNNSPNAAGLTSKILADAFAESIPANLGTLKRGSRAEKYTVVHKNTVPAVLIELGFLSNENDHALLTDANFQENAARTIYETLLQVLKKYPTGR